MLCSIATKINESTLQTITDLEKELGATLPAFRCHSLKPTALSTDKLQRVQEIESKHGEAKKKHGRGSKRAASR